MTVDIASIRPGGRVSVTLTDGTKIIDSPVTEDRHGNRYFVNGLLVLSPFGGALPDDTVIDAYSPPAPEWDRDGVYAIKDRHGDIWCRITDAEHEWVCREADMGSRDAPYIEAGYSPCTVYALYAEGVER